MGGKGTLIKVPLLCTAAIIPLFIGGIIVGGKNVKNNTLTDKLEAVTITVESLRPTITTFSYEILSLPTQETESLTRPEEETGEITEPPVEETPKYRDIKPEDRELLMRIAIAEVGGDDCTECMALVMLTVLNRVEYDGFSSTVRGVIYAKDQFTPVADGRFEQVSPNERCHEALELVMSGWDESQGALFFESCNGPSWHSKNLSLLFSHCHTRFYTYPHLVPEEEETGELDETQ